MSFRARHLQSLLEVNLERSEHDVGESTLQAAHRFQRALAGGALASVVVLAGSGEAGLDERRDVQGVVEPAVPAAAPPSPLPTQP